MKPIRVTPPAALPVTLAEVKGLPRIAHTDDDMVLDGLIAAAVALLDGYGGLLGRAIMAQTWRQPFGGWWGAFSLPMPDVRDVAVTYTDADGVTQTVPAADYEVIETHTGPEVRFLSGFSVPTVKTGMAQPVSVTFTAGAVAAADVDARIKIAIGMLVMHWDLHGGVTTDAREASVPWGVDAMIASIRGRSI